MGVFRRRSTLQTSAPEIRGGGRGTSAMMLGTLASAIGAYLFQVIGGRALGADVFAPVSVVWSVLFLSFTVVLIPIEQLVIRRLTLARGHASALASSRRTIGIVLVAGTVATMAFALAMVESFFAGDIGYVLVVGAIFPGHGLFAVARGSLAGRARFSAYGIAVALDAMAKLVGAIVVISIGLGPVALAWALVMSPLIVFLVSPFRDNSERTATSISTVSDRKFLTGFLIANAASQTILGAGPLVVGWLGASAAAISVFFVTMTLFRGPMSASYHLIARVLPDLTRRAAVGDREWLDRLALRLGIGGLALGAIGGVTAGWVGPDVVEFLYGSDFTPTAQVAGFLAAGVAAGLAGLAVTQILVGRGDTNRLAIVWMIAIGLAAAAVYLIPTQPPLRVAIGFVVGEYAALVGLVVAVLTSADGNPR